VTAVTETHWEVGGEFHSPVETPRPFHPWPRPAVWYALGRHAVEALVQMLQPAALWLPDYFCHEVAVGWERLVDVRTYEDDPRWAEPRWETLQPAPGDLVLAVNYFGARERTGWEDRGGGDFVLVEDHSHDPFSPSALGSTADFAFSSLRKTLPVPDGAILWSPRSLDLPPQPRAPAEGSELKLAAMLLKGRFLEHGGEDHALKERFRRLQLEGEEQLAKAPVAAASPAAREAVIGGAPLPWRVRRADNAVHLLGALSGLQVAEPLFDEWPAGVAPLGVVLLFGLQEARDRVRETLREAGVYCPVHWAIERPASERVRDLSARVLTIPTDWRYSAADMERVAALLHEADTRV
jgi:hypothetical protein